jgi:hypothetical protein
MADGYITHWTSVFFVSFIFCQFIRKTSLSDFFEVFHLLSRELHIIYIGSQNLCHLAYEKSEAKIADIVVQNINSEYKQFLYHYIPT